MIHFQKEGYTVILIGGRSKFRIKEMRYKDGNSDQGEIEVTVLALKMKEGDMEKGICAQQNLEEAK